MIARALYGWLMLALITSASPAAMYYVGPGSNTSPYDTAAKASLLPATVVTAGNTDVGGEGPHVVNIAAGSYASSMNLADEDWAGATIIGAGQATTEITYAAGNCITLNGPDNITISGLSIRPTALAGKCVYQYATSTGIVFNDCTFTNPGGYALDLVSVYGGTCTFRRCTFRQKWNTTSEEALWTSGDAAATLEYCIVTPPLGFTTCAEVYLNGTGTNTIVNCLFLGSAEASVRAALGTTNIYNSVFLGGVQDASPVNGGTRIHLYNSIVYSNPWQPAWVSGALLTDQANNYTGAYPKFATHGRVGYLIPCVDDASNLAYAQSLGTVLAAYGAHGTFYSYQANIGGGDYSAYRALVANGIIEVGGHSNSHSDLAYTHALSFSQAGGANPTVTFDGTTITCECDGTNYDQSYVVTGKKLSEIITALNGVKGWTVAKSTTGGQDAAGVRDDIRATSLAVLGVTAAPCNIDLDLTGVAQGYFKDEIADPKTWMADTLINGAGNVTDPQTGATYVCRTFAAPFHDASIASRTAVIDAGYIFGRQKYVADSHITLIPLTDFDAYRQGTYIVGTGNLNNASEATVRAMARSLAVTAVECGLAIPVLAHNESDLTLAQWAYVLDEWAKFGSSLKVCSMQEFADDVRAPPWTDDLDGTYSRTYTAYTDYHLTADSPFINAGMAPGPTWDLSYSGVSQGRFWPWDIGAEVYSLAAQPGDRDRYVGQLRSRYAR